MNSEGTNFLFHSLQEVILKRAADLVEALYGMPHNNQVNVLFLKSLLYDNIGTTSRTILVEYNISSPTLSVGPLITVTSFNNNLSRSVDKLGPSSALTLI